MKIEAGQHIYTNVTKDRSPKNEGGYQTLYYTHSYIDDRQSEEIEAKLVYFSSENKEIKKIFFRLNDEIFVVSQITPSDDKDEFGRSGIYFAHTLLIKNSEFDKIASNPFIIFDNFKFNTSVNDALNGTDFKKQDIETINLDLAEISNNLPDSPLLDWNKITISKLCSLAVNADELHKNKVSLLFKCNPSETENILKGIFAFIPSELTKKLSFDTYFNSCNILYNYFWAVGLEEKKTDPKFIFVNTSQKSIDEITIKPKNNSFENWLTDTLNKEDGIKTVFQNKEYAYLLSKWIEDKITSSDLPLDISDDIIKSFFAVNKDAIKKFIKIKNFTEYPESLFERLFDEIYDKADILNIYSMMKNGFKSDHILEKIKNVYRINNYKKPDMNEIKFIAELSQKNNDLFLCTISSIWAKNIRNTKEFSEKLSENDYRNIFNIITSNDLTNPLSVLVKGKEILFIELYFSKEDIKKLDLAKIFDKLKKLNENINIDMFYQYIDVMDIKDLNTLLSYCETLDDVPKEIIKKLKNLIEEKTPKNIVTELVENIFKNKE